MNDTPDSIRRKQFEIIFSKPEQERVLMGFRMMDDARALVESGICSQHPGISELDLRIEVLRRYYRNDFSAAEMERIVESMRTYWAEREKDRPDSPRLH